MLVLVPCLALFSVGCSGVTGGTLPGDTTDDGPSGDPPPLTDTDPGSDPDPITDTDMPADEDPAEVYGLFARPSQSTCLPFTPPPVTAGYHFADRFPLLHSSSATAFNQPTGLFHRPNDNSRFYVTERAGKIKSFANDPTVTEADVTVFVDLTANTFSGSDCSMSALAFPANFATSKVVYISRCYSPDKGASTPHVQVRVSRFHMAAKGDVLDPGSEQVLIAANYRTDPESFNFSFPGANPAVPDRMNVNFNTPGTIGLHGVDVMRMGPDGYMYMTIGDGGPQGVGGGTSAQNLKTVRGKMLRYDVSDLSAAIPAATLPNLDDLPASWPSGGQYLAVTAPADNPFYTVDQQNAEIARMPLRSDSEMLTAPNPITQLVYAYGFRNPWQWHFDSQDGSIWLGDVGNNTFEEVDRQLVKGGNYGWGYFEGLQCTNTSSYNNGWSTAQCDYVRPNVHRPMLEYVHTGGNAITGGTVYRGALAPAYSGAYFFGDYSARRVWAVKNVDALTSEPVECLSSADCASGLICRRNGRPCDPTPVRTCADGSTCDTATSKCTDGKACIAPVCHDGSTCNTTTSKCADGESCVDQTGNTCNTTAHTSFCEPTFSKVIDGVQISAFGEDLTNGDLYGIFLNSDFQGAKIARFEQVPAEPGTGGGPPLYLSQTGCFVPSAITQPVEDLIPFEPGARLWSDGATKRRWFTVPDTTTVSLAPDGDFLWPDGTMLVKEFALNDKKVETRFMVKQVANSRWAGYSYAWNDAQTDATLVRDIGDNKVWDGQTWYYPGRSQCFQCHTDIANTSLGLETAQLNHAMAYEATAITANQIDTLIHIGVVDPSSDPPPYTDLPYVNDLTRPIEERARAYLHANCSGCHRPDGPTFVDMDLRYEATFADMKVCNASPQISDMEDIIPSDPKLFAPGDPSRSEIFQRMQTSGKYRMPPVARTLPDNDALAVVSAWITGVTACP